MNSLNLISSRVIGRTSISRPRSTSLDDTFREKRPEQLEEKTLAKRRPITPEGNAETTRLKGERRDEISEPPLETSKDSTEKTPLLKGDETRSPIRQSRLRYLVKRLADALTAILNKLGAPIVYLATCFQDDNGRYSPLIPLRRVRGSLSRRKAGVSTGTAVGLSNASSGETWESEKLSTKRNGQDGKLRHSYSHESLRSTTSESDSENRKPKRNATDARSKSRLHSLTADSDPPRRSIRIKVHSEDSAKRRKDRKEHSSDDVQDTITPPLTVDNIKSPTSHSHSLRVTRYPHAPQPPRPLIPKRQPSYSNLVPRSPPLRPSSGLHQQKTLIIDLDETLIHSLAKGGRMSSGHMVEVKLNAPVLAPVSSISNQSTPVIGPQHPILYYVHKRPHCDEFLRKVYKWYKLVVFTASVQEYADPVIDWLEQERKFFTARYYRQHCTFRNGAYIKDLSSIEPDLSRVIILDNSPMSYIFHEDNAIPIEGWISDPTDNDLQHLIPFLEALQYVTDVRALLALRRGEADA